MSCPPKASRHLPARGQRPRRRQRCEPRGASSRQARGPGRGTGVGALRPAPWAASKSVHGTTGPRAREPALRRYVRPGTRQGVSQRVCGDTTREGQRGRGRAARAGARRGPRPPGSPGRGPPSAPGRGRASPRGRGTGLLRDLHMARSGLRGPRHTPALPLRGRPWRGGAAGAAGDAILQPAGFLAPTRSAVDAGPSVAPWLGPGSGERSEAGDLRLPGCSPALWPPGRPRPPALHPQLCTPLRWAPTRERALAPTEGRCPTHEARAVRTHASARSLLGQVFSGNVMCNCPDLGKLGWVPHQDGRNCGWGWVSPAALAAVRGRGGLGARRVDGSASWLPPSCARTEPAGHRGDAGCQAARDTRGLGHLTHRRGPSLGAVTGSDAVQAPGAWCRVALGQAEASRGDCVSDPCVAGEAPAAASLRALEVQPAG